MDVFSFVSDIVGSLSWPIAVALIVIFLRKPIIALLNRITRISHSQTRVDLAPLVVSRDRAESTGSLSPSNPVTDATARESIADSPRAAIIEAWIKVETAANEALQKKTGSNLDALSRIRPLSRGALIRLLREHELADERLDWLLRELMNLRNQAAHELNLDIDSEVALVYVESADRVAAELLAKIVNVQPNVPR